MFIKPSMIEQETCDQCNLVIDGKGFPHDFVFYFFLEPPKYHKIKLEVKNVVHESTSLKILLFLMFIKPSRIELGTWDQYHLVMDG